MYDKPLKIQWTEINGRTVPLVLPQYWSDEQNDWVVSSEQNRLPVDAQLTGSTVPEEVLIDDETLFAGSTITTSELSTKNANEIRFVLTCSVNIFDDLNVFFADVALDGGFSRYTIEDVRGETRYKTFVVKPASTLYRVRLTAEGDQDINVTLQAFYYYS